MAAEKRRSSSETGLFLLAALLLLVLCAFALTKARDGFTIQCEHSTVDLSDLALSGSQEAWEKQIAECFPGPVDGVPGSVNSSLLWDQLFIALYVPALILLCAYGGLRSRRRPTRRLGWFMVYVTVFAGVMDLIEDHLLWRAFYRPPPSSTLLHVLFATSLAKWVVVLPMLYGLLSLTTAISRLARHDRTPPGGPVPSGLLPGPPAFLDPRHVAAPTPEAVKHRYKRPDATPADATGICLSGGGIRAAAFAMGALQSLESAGVYGQATYLATVSGGGYLGTAAHLAGTRSEPAAPEPFQSESPEAAYVREHARFLWPTPKQDRHGAGFISTATTAVFSILFNLVLAAVCIYAIATPVGWAGHALFGERGTRPEGWLLATILVTIALGPLVTMAWARTLGRWIPGFRRWVAAAIAGAVTTAAAVQLLWFDVPYWWFWYALGALVAVFAIGFLVQKVQAKRHPARRSTGIPLLFFLPAPVLGLIAFFLWEWWFGLAFASGWHGATSPLFAWWAVGLTAGALVGIMAAQLIRRIWAWTHRDPKEREPSPTWFTLGAPAAAIVGAATALLVIVDRGRSIVLIVAAVALILWLFGMIAFVRQQHSAGDRPGRSGVIGLLTGGLALIVIVGALAHAIVKDDVTAWVVWAGFALGLLLLYYLVDQKAWSPHGMYKGRLASTFSRVRTEGGTAPLKDTPLDSLAPSEGHPQLLICAAAYDTHHCPGEVQAWPFTFARDFVGAGDVGWCRTEDFRSSLGNFNRSDATVQAAMAVSGAAVSPGLGQIRLGSVNALIVLANLRLGVWLPAPRYVNQLMGVEGWSGTREGPLPRWIRWRRFTYLFKEVFSIHDPTDRFLLVTDGGQVDNLGLLELLSRRCRLIICIDASGDNKSGRPLGTRTLDGVRRLAYERYGVRMRLRGTDGDNDPPDDPDPADLPFTPNAQLLTELVTVSNTTGTGDVDQRTAVAAVAVVDVHYPAVPGGLGPEAGEDAPAASGTLVYAKALLFKDLTDDGDPPFIKFASGRKGRRFPSDSTGDQWPDEAQFTMYERLGRVVGLQASQRAKAELETEPAAQAAAGQSVTS